MAWAPRRRIGAESAAKMNIDRSAELAASVNMDHGPSAGLLHAIIHNVLQFLIPLFIASAPIFAN